ncbi:MAG: hypothetical protein AB7I27_16465 [Bacteriovoracaceae bacterium]
MSQKAEILLEGTYLYFQGETNYCQEEFKLVQFPDTQALHIYSEILSRLETGEVLKILVRLEMGQHYNPHFLRIEKSMGKKYVQEIFKVDAQTQELHYSFQNTQTNQEFSRPIGPRQHLVSPAFATAGLFTLSKKLDTTNRTPTIFLSSPNEWDYQGPPSEKIVHVEKSSELSEFKVGAAQVTASHFKLYESDSSHKDTESPVELFISKHHGIPYQLLHDDQKIVVKTLKKTDR